MGVGYARRASRSAWLSHPFSSRITLSRAGMPFGKSVARRASRSTVAVAVRALALRGARVALGVLARVAELAERPATPCARFRWAPSDAAREKVLPHSGQVRLPAPGVTFRRPGADAAFVLVAALRVVLLVRALGIPITSRSLLSGQSTIATRLSRRLSAYLGDRVAPKAGSLSLSRRA